jgi:hypothetical protein
MQSIRGQKEHHPMTKRYYEGGWHNDIMRNAKIYLPSGEYDEFANIELNKIEGAISIPRYAYEQLLGFIREHEIGVLKTDREEDLKIIHRLLDILGAKP